jgi:hypothetical protein
LALLLSSTIWIGCASPGPPRAPSLHLPEVVTDLAVERTGNEVHLHWTTPTKTTDGITITGPITAQVCRQESPIICAPTQRVPVVHGPSSAVEVLPTPMTEGAARLLTYRVELRNAHEHSAGLSAPALAVAGPAPPIVADLRATATAQGALLRWSPQDASDSIEIVRKHAPSGLASGKPAAKEPDEIRLRAGRDSQANGPFQLDPGGTLDATAHRGETYTYTAQRLRSVTIAGHTLELRSSSSPAISLAMRDVFPPHQPTGLEAIANPSSPAPSIDLSWQPNVEPDLAGYHIYRQEGSSAAVNLTPELIPVPGFRDLSVVVGHRYLYSVTAVDAAGNESQRAPFVSEELRQP